MVWTIDNVVRIMNLWNQNELDVKKLNKPYWYEINADPLGIEVTGFPVWMVAHKRQNLLCQCHLGVQIEVFGKCINCVNTDFAWKIHYWFWNNALFPAAWISTGNTLISHHCTWNNHCDCSWKKLSLEHFPMPVQSKIWQENSGYKEENIHVTKPLLRLKENT